MSFNIRAIFFYFSILIPTIVSKFEISYYRIITIQSSPDKPDKEEEDAATLTREEAATGLAVGSATDSGVNLYILAGHEAMQL